MERLGIDIGGSGVKGALVDTATGELTTKRYRIATPQPATPKVKNQITVMICKQRFMAPKPLEQYASTMI